MKIKSYCLALANLWIYMNLRECNFFHFLIFFFVTQTELTHLQARIDFTNTMSLTVSASLWGRKTIIMELSLCHKLWFSNPYIFGFQHRKALTFQTMTFVRSNNISLKYQRFMTSGSKDIRIRKSEFVAKSQFLNYIL